MDASVYPPLANVKTRRRFNIKISTVVSGTLLIAIAIFIKIISLFPYVIEKYYSMGIYPYIAAFYRSLFGWLPFSFGDVFYFAAGSYLRWLFIKFVRAVLHKRFTKIDFIAKAKSTCFTLAAIYIYFNLSWGLNYNRPGIATQLGLTPQMHNEADLKNITSILLQKMNYSRRLLGTNKLLYKPYEQVFLEAQVAYGIAANSLPFMTYKTASVKRSMYGPVGNYLGFLGYYNPFTGEAQLNPTMPRFLLPYVACHEMAHQLGYASESEASFVGYLATMSSTDHLFQYSTYFDMFYYANHELYIRDSAAAKINYNKLDTLVKTDLAEVRNYWRKSDNFFEPIVKIFYDHYLKANQQSKGVKSYNEVVGWLIAYHKKFGKV